MKPSEPESFEPAGVAIPAAAVTVFGERAQKAERYHRLLIGAGVERGLIGPREAPRVWDRHILNCAVIGELISDGATVVDIGSGAGLPGIPLALARPDLHVTLVEPLMRRVSFLETAVADLDIDVEVIRGRAEEKAVMAKIGMADVVTSRAVAPLDRLVGWSAPLLREGGMLAAIKGSSASEEIDRDAVGAARKGVVDLAVVTCGRSVVDPPTTVVIGRRVPAREPRAASGRRGVRGAR